MNDTCRILPRCPVCGRYYDERPALSRKDNKTKICSMCGMREALEVLFNNDKTNKILK